jgi:hypothetical protein
LLAVAFALVREVVAARDRPSLLIEVASRPTVPAADLRLLAELWRVWPTAELVAAAELAEPVAERRVVVEVPEALLPEALEALPEFVAEERRVVPDCWAEERLAEAEEDCAAAEEALPLLRETLLLPEAVELRRVWPLCAAAEELLRDAEAALLREALDCVAAEELRDTVAAEERDAAEDLETLEEDAEPDMAELPLVLEDLVAELPELVPVALRLACAFNASGVRVIAIARSVTIRVLSKVFIRLIDIIFFGD